MMKYNDNIYNDVKIEKIPAEQFEFAQTDSKIHDTKFETKARGYFADALIRFKKSKAAVAGAWIIFALFLFSIISPIVSPYKITDQDKFYVSYPPFVRAIADLKLGILDGSVTMDSQNDLTLAYWNGIGAETGYNPYIKTISTTQQTTKYRGQDKVTNSYKIKVNKYYSQGVMYLVMS